MIQGTPKFDGIAVAKFEIDFLRTPVHIEIKAAFVNSKTGATHGWTTGDGNISDKTRALMLELRNSMEQDLAERHFSSGGVAFNSLAPRKADAVGGIGEHLGAVNEDGARSV